MKNKRGISPLIATVLIIGFTIALAAIIMTWGGGFVRETTERTEASADMALKCSTELDFEIKAVDAGAGKVTIENRGNIKILSLKFRFYSDIGEMLGNPYDTPVGEFIEAFGVKTFSSVPVDGVKIDAIAVISDNAGGEYICGQASREKMFTAAVL